MKKVIWLGIIILGMIVAALFVYQSKINDEISSKKAELNNNGFSVKQEQSTNYISTSAKGEIEIVEPDKVAALFSTYSKDEDLRKNFMNNYNTLSLEQKELFLKGVKFDYDFVVENFTGKANINLYLTSLSKTVMDNLSQKNDLNSKWLLDFLKDKKLQISVNEKKEYKIADIDGTLPQGNVNILTKDIHGDEKNLSVSSIKISDVNGSFAINDINMDYEIDVNKQNSKTLIKNIAFHEADTMFEVKNFIVNSSYEKDSVNMNTKSEFGFDEVNVKSFDGRTSTLKNTSFTFDINNFPYKNLEQYAMDLSVGKYEDYLKTLIQSGLSVNSNGMASSYDIKTQKIFDTLKFNLNLKLNKNIPQDKVENFTDIFENAKLTVDLDLQTAQNLKTLLNLRENSNIEFTDASDNLKRFEAILKNDGLYINDKKVLEKNQLALPQNNDEVFDDTADTTDTTDTEKSTIKKISQKDLTYKYKMIDDNLLQLDIKYTPNLKVVSSGGISVSFPQLKDAKRITKKMTNSFDEINFYEAGTKIWNGGLEQNVDSSYLLVEGWDDNWNKGGNKEMSLIIDTKDLKDLVVYLRAGSLNENSNNGAQSEIVPQDGDLDQQNYPVEMVDIPLFRLSK
jgi:hypothetical protein